MSRSVLCAALLLMVEGCRAPRVPAPEALEKVPSNQFPEVQRWRLANGLTVLLHTDPELPLVEGSLFLPGGSLWDDTGSVAAAGALLREGGAGGYSSAELDELIEEAGAEISSDYGKEYGRIDFHCLSGSIDMTAELVAAMVVTPRFEEGRLDLWKKQQREVIRRRKDDPQTVAQLAFTQLLFGNTTFGRVLTTADIESLDRGKILRAFERFVRPHGAILAVSGDLQRPAAEELIERHFGGWRNEAAQPLPPPALHFRPEPGIYFVEMPFAQATVWLGHHGPRRHSPDEFAIRVFNEVFGGGSLASRLMQRIRVQSGLAYAAWGAILPELSVGQNVISLQTKAATAAEALAAAGEVLVALQQAPIAAAELELAKQGLINSFIFKFETPQQIVEREALLQLLGYPPDYDRQYQAAVATVSAAMVQQAAAAHWDLARSVVVVVGNREALKTVEALRQKGQGPFAGLALHRVRFKERLHVPLS